MRSLSVPVALVVASALLCACASPVATAERPTAAAMMSSSLPPESPTPVPTLEPTPTVPADAEAETGLAGGDSVPIGPGTVVKTIADDGLRLRSDPSAGDDSAKCEPLLPLGTPLMILDGPVSGSGYEWYEVASLTPTACSHGWVASASRENEPWIEPAEFDCPAKPTDQRSLAAMPAGVGLLCFAGEPITVTARLLSCDCDMDGPGFTPNWFFDASGSPALLVDPAATTIDSDVSEWFTLNLDPDGDHPRELPIGDVVEVTGVFDHPAAASCTMTEMDGQPVPIRACRLQFAVTRLVGVAP